MRTIYKYPIPFLEDFTIDLPKGAEVIRVDNVDGHLFIWAVVDTEAPMEPRQFHGRKTGSETPAVPENVRYIGCAGIHIQMELMLYFFEPTEEQRNKEQRQAAAQLEYEQGKHWR